MHSFIVVAACVLAVICLVSADPLPQKQHLNVKYSFISNLCGDNSDQQLIQCCKKCKKVLATGGEGAGKDVYLTCRKSGCSGAKNVDCACEDCDIIPEGKENESQYDPGITYPVEIDSHLVSPIVRWWRMIMGKSSTSVVKATVLLGLLAMVVMASTEPTVDTLAQPAAIGQEDLSGMSLRRKLSNLNSVNAINKGKGGRPTKKAPVPLNLVNG